jgi:hypothetical protein
MDPGPFRYARHTATTELHEAAEKVLDPRAFEARALYDDIARGRLVIHARHRDADGALHAVGEHLATGEHLHLHGEGNDRRISALFTSSEESRQDFRARVLHQAPSPGRRADPDLPAFAEALAARLPGQWASSPHDLTLDAPQIALGYQVWERSELSWAVAELVLREAAVLDGPDGARLLVIHRPARRTQFLIGALEPPGFTGYELQDTAPHAIAVDRDPARAADGVARRFLPRYDAVVARLRLESLATTLQGAEQAEAAWDAVSDSYCDEHGVPHDDAAYGEAKWRTRDAPAWARFETFLIHAPALLAEAHATAEALDPADAAGWRYRLGALTAALKGGHHVQAEWATDSATLRERNGEVLDQRRYDHAEARRDAEGWHYVSEWLAHGPVLLEIAQAEAEPQASAAPRRAARAEAALARSTTTATPVRAATAPPQASDTPVPGGPRPSRSR